MAKIKEDSFDCIVLGTGGIGSAALYFAAQKGWNVLGIDQFDPPHGLGSTHGHTRIIRTAYFEHPAYVPLARQARQLWDSIQAQIGQELLVQTGLLQVGDASGDFVAGLMQSINAYQLPVRILSPAEASELWPTFRIDQQQVAIVEDSAGYLKVEDCVAACLDLAKGAGAKHLANTRVIRWQKASQIEVETDQGKFLTDRLIICGGAWSSRLLKQESLDLSIRRKSQFWFEAASQDPRVDELKKLPTWFFETDQGCFYGFPFDENVGLKVAEHTGGQAIEDPSEVDREIHQEDLDRVTDFIHDRFRGFDFRLRSHSVCMYTMTPDEHFVIDRMKVTDRTNSAAEIADPSGHQALDQPCPNESTDLPIVFAAGMSGHAFKFAPVIGKQLVDLLVGESNPDMEFLKLESSRGS